MDRSRFRVMVRQLLQRAQTIPTPGLPGLVAQGVEQECGQLILYLDTTAEGVLSASYFLDRIDLADRLLKALDV